MLEQLEAKVERLAARKRELKAQLLSAQRKEQVFVQRMDAHMDEVPAVRGGCKKKANQRTTEHTRN